VTWEVGVENEFLDKVSLYIKQNIDSQAEVVVKVVHGGQPWKDKTKGKAERGQKEKGIVACVCVCGGGALVVLYQSMSWCESSSCLLLCKKFWMVAPEQSAHLVLLT
jgi:hypothetical protein